MNATPKTRLCWNCEGRVSSSEPNCPYCDVYLGVEEGVAEKSSHEDHHAPYNPEGQEEGKSIADSPYQINIQEDEEESSSYSNKEVILTTAMLSSGVLFFLFGFVLYAFGEEGSLTLRWDASYWYIYFFGAIPLIFFGWRSLGTLNHE